MKGSKTKDVELARFFGEQGRRMMSNRFFEHPILIAPYAYPLRHWELDKDGQSTQKVIETRRRADFITPNPKPRKEDASPPGGDCFRTILKYESFQT